MLTAAPDWNSAIARVRSGGVPERDEQQVLANGLRILLRGRTDEEVRRLTAEVLLRVWVRVRRGHIGSAQELGAAAREELLALLAKRPVG